MDSVQKANGDGLTYDMVKMGLSQMARMMQGGKTINDAVVEDWFDQLNKRKVTAGLFNHTIDRIISQEDRYPSLKAFCDAMSNQSYADGESDSFMAYDCECLQCRYTYSVKIDNRYTPDTQFWFCTHCNHSQNVKDSLSDRQPSIRPTAEQSERLRNLFKKKSERSGEGFTLISGELKKPTNREGLIIAIKACLEEEYLYAGRGNKDAIEAVDTWEFCFKSSTEAGLNVLLANLIKEKSGQEIKLVEIEFANEQEIEIGEE
jgi:hypothetical protein